MGCLESSAKAEHVLIESAIELERIQFSRRIKILMLGSGESGKSTLLKQFRIINHDAFRSGVDDDELLIFRDIVRHNCIQSMQSLIGASFSLNLPIVEVENRPRALRLQARASSEAWPAFNNNRPEGKVSAKQIVDDLESLWKDEGIQKVYQRRKEFQLLESCEYFLDNLQRISEQNYIPTRMDIIRSRVKTTGVIETEFEHNGFKYKVVDVGGQRSERRKWAHLFEEITSLIFVTSLSEIGEKCYEDHKTPRVQESLKIFQQITNSRWFVNTPIILFFNKVDLLENKVENFSGLELHEYMQSDFPNFRTSKMLPSSNGNSGGESISPSPDDDDGSEPREIRGVEVSPNATKIGRFLLQEFKKVGNVENRKIYPHFTNATDTQGIATVMEAVKDKIFEQVIADMDTN